MNDENASFSTGDFVSDVHSNLASDIIRITEDKVRNCLTDYERNRKSRNAWNTPFGILFTIGSVLITADFKNLLLPPNYWFAIFAVSGIGCLIWLIQVLISREKSMTIDDLINKMKNSSSNGL